MTNQPLSMTKHLKSMTKGINPYRLTTDSGTNVVAKNTTFYLPIYFFIYIFVKLLSIITNLS